jgi:serine/threonine-protein kinase
LGTNDIFVNSLDRDLTRQLTSDRGTENGPMWSPDGKTIVYAAGRHGPPSLHARNADGSGEERELVPAAPGGPQVTGSFTPDGLSLIFHQPNPGTDYDVMLLPLDGHAPPAAIVKTKGRDLSARISRDGRWLAYVSTESGRAEVYVEAFPDGHGRQLVSRDGGSVVRWRGDSRELYFIAGPESNRVMAVALAFEGNQIKPASPRLLFVAHEGIGAYDVIREGDRFLVVSPDPIAARGTISVIANWTHLLGK